MLAETLDPADLLPGHEADCYLAEIVMGWAKTATVGLFKDAEGTFHYAGEKHKDGLPGFCDYAKFRPTTNADAAYQLAERIYALGMGWMVIRRDSEDGYCAACEWEGRYTGHAPEWHDIAETVPLAMSRAALVAWGIYHKQEDKKEKRAKRRTA